MPGPALRTRSGAPRDDVVRADRRAQTVDALPPTFTAVALVLGLLVPANLLLAPPPASLVTAAVSGSLALLLAAARVACTLPRGRAVVEAHPHEVGLVACLVTSLFPLSQLLLTPDPLASGGLMVFLLATGTLMNERRYSLVVTVVCLLQWVAAAAAHGALLDWAAVGVVLVCAAVLAHLLNAIRCRAADRSAAAEADALRAAATDELTGLANRRGLLAAAGTVLATAGPGRPVTAVYVDVDGLKRLNDRHGHDAGDRLLLAAAEALRSAAGPGDVVARLGGDEFVLLAGAAPPGEPHHRPHDGPDPRPGGEVPAAGARLRVETALAAAGVPASTGSARSEGGEAVESLLDRADAAMYARKRGPGRVPAQPVVPPAAGPVPSGPGWAGRGGTVLADLRDMARACTWLHLAVVPAHLLLLPSPAGGTVSAVSVAVSACFALLVLADRLPGLRAGVARHAPSLLCAGMVVVCAEMVVYDAVVALPWASLPVVLGVVAAGGTLSTRLQVAVVCPATVAAWGVVTVVGGVPEGWLWGALTLGCALGVAALLHLTHHRTMRRLAAARSRVREAALTDELTGLANRRAFLGTGRGLVGASLRRGEQAAVLFLDLDGLKQVNDRQGHAAGDRVLVAAADALRRSVGPHDLLARLAGDEFTVLLPSCPPAEVPARAARLEAALAGAGVAASIGAARLPDDASSLDELLARADEAMLRVKASRRDPSRGPLPVA